MFLDAHNHLASAPFAPHLPLIFADLTAAGITGAVVNGTDESDWPLVSQLSSRNSQLSVLITPSYGLHPWDVGNRSPAWLDALRHYLVANPHAAVGEIGLDRWMLDRARPDDLRLAGLRRAPLNEQLAAFTAQIALAHELQRPLTIHCIDAFGLLLETLQSLHATDRLPARGFLLHAYSGSAELITPFASLGAYFSFNGAYLARRHRRLREIFQLVPLDRLLVETDAPAMLPPPEHAPFRFPPRPTEIIRPTSPPPTPPSPYSVSSRQKSSRPRLRRTSVGSSAKPTAIVEAPKILRPVFPRAAAIPQNRHGNRLPTAAALSRKTFRARLHAARATPR